MNLAKIVEIAINFIRNIFDFLSKIKKEKKEVKVEMEPAEEKNFIPETEEVKKMERPKTDEEWEEFKRRFHGDESP
jgi:hypothetical protein